jgi:MFS transporter, PPP family, 3-phenylpropionic acid transporter
MSWAYATYYMAIGCFWPYIVLYYRQLGLSGGEIGLLTALPAIAQVLSAPAWSMIADLYNAHRLVLRAALVSAALAAVLLAQMARFTALLPLVALLALCIAPTTSLLDTFGVTIAAQSGISYGRLRVWGSVGYTLTAWLIGWLMGSDVSSLFFVGYALGLLLYTGATLGLPPVQRRAKTWSWRDSLRIDRRPVVLIVLLTIVLVSSMMSIMFNFFGIYLAGLGGGAEIVGIANAIGTLSELPVMALGGLLLSRLGSRRLLVLSIMVFGVRFLLYSIIPSSDWVLPVQLLHGLSFASYLMAGVTLVHELVGSELAATAQGLLASAFAGGQIMGSLVGGLLLDQVGVIYLYRLVPVVLLLAMSVLLVGLRRFAKPGDQAISLSWPPVA